MSSLLFHSDYDGIEGWDTFGDRNNERERIILDISTLLLRKKEGGGGLLSIRFIL